MKKAQRDRKLSQGSAIIMKEGLPSQKQIDAHNLWRAVVLLQCRLDKHSMRIHEVRPEDVIDWV